jgi:DNA-binding MarR family transcriptional regulator
MKTEIKVQSTSFEINKLITTTQLFSQVKLSLSARLVLRCIVDYWNFKMSCAYPTQQTIAKCTGLTDVSVGSAVNELYTKGLIEKKKHKKRIYYYFTLKFLGYLNLLPKVIYVNTQKNLGNIPQKFLGKNILKENENTFSSNFQNSNNNLSADSIYPSSNLSSEADSSEFDDTEEPLSDEESHLAFAKATIKH